MMKEMECDMVSGSYNLWALNMIEMGGLINSQLCCHTDVMRKEIRLIPNLLQVACHSLRLDHYGVLTV
jgi:hypothetical protein